MIFSRFRKPKCSVCRRKFQTYDAIKSSDAKALDEALSMSEFGCTRCKIKFHGICGKIGQASPRTATVTCPACHTRIKHDLPFKVEVVKSDPTRQVGERLDKPQGDELE